MIKGIAGVIIWTANVERLGGFYRDVLDMKPVSQRDGFMAFQFGDLRLTISTHSEVDDGAKDPLRIMVNLAVDDIHSEYQRLRRKGVEFLREPEKEHWGGLHSHLQRHRRQRTAATATALRAVAP